MIVIIRFLLGIFGVSQSSAAATTTASQHTDDPSSFVRGPRRRTQQTILQDYRLYEADEIPRILQNWTTLYKDFVQLTTAQEAYGLPSAGSRDDCPLDGCLIYILTIQDYVVHPVNSESSKRLPEVLWNGQVHGDERVGPTALLEAAHLLLMAAACEAQITQNNNDQCRQDLLDRGIDDKHRQWLARLLVTRRIVMIPTANPWGYARNVRTEFDVDVNRDFPFDAPDATSCMRTIAARAINELVREHMFQSGIVFHGGFEMIGYEWGATQYEGWRSPDDTSQSQIAEAHSRFGGGWSDSPPYVYGSMDEVIYTVQGSLEDWGYASSWDTNLVTPCAPTTFGGYPAEKTIYPPYTNRMFSMLVETSLDKTPTTNLGTSLDVLNPESSGTGHVPRNIRLSLLMVDLVEPYVRFTNDSSIVPLQARTSDSCRTNHILTIDDDSEQRMTVSWEVGGAFQVDQTDLWYAKWDDLTTLDCRMQPSISDVQTYMQRGVLTGPLRGGGRFSRDGSTVFEGTIPLSDFSDGDAIVVLASARVDSSWANAASLVRPRLPPQSHLANVRTNPDYYYESETNIVQGRLHWFSQPLTVKVVSSTVSPTESPHAAPSVRPFAEDDSDDPGVPTPDIETPESSSSPKLGSPIVVWMTSALCYFASCL